MTSQVRLTDVLGSPPATPGTGKVSLYINGKKLYGKDDTGAIVLYGGKDPESKAIIIENPTASEDLSFFFTDVALTISKIVVVLVGSTPSVTWTMRHGTSRSAGGSEVVTGGTVTTDTGSGEEITTFDDATVVADSHVWIETTAQSGTVASMIINIFYDED
jgi:hypothetical protein